MILSHTSVELIRDLLENRLSMMSVGDQDDLREQIALKRALTELVPASFAASGLSAFDDIPRRGRRRKVTGSAGEAA